MLCFFCINKWKTNQFKTVYNGDTAYSTQPKQQISRRCNCFVSISP